MAGKVFVNGRLVDKPGTVVESNAEIKLLEPENPFVSRGGLKLEGALNDLELDVGGLVVLDVGASTGGFTDCLLTKGARLVYALDVGYGQLDLRLRSDPRVVVMERFNVRSLKQEDLPSRPDLAVIDVSFISLSKVMPVMEELEVPAVLALVKPQFEAGKKDASRGKGVIRDPQVHKRILYTAAASACSNSYCFRGAAFSRWPGPKGNIEYFLLLENGRGKSCSCPQELSLILDLVVDSAHSALSANSAD
jgi:23S rRNA (cytidine1920-2'-O)/16S rRNA (cytidine1409-2'-O)-methyltransferase